MAIGELSGNGPCAVTWIPVLTSGPPGGRGITAKDVGVIRRWDGNVPGDLQGMPLYLYSSEEAVFSAGQPQTTGTVGNGNGLRGPYGGTFSIEYPS